MSSMRRSIRKLRSGVLIFLSLLHLSVLKEVISRSTAVSVEKVETVGIIVPRRKPSRHFSRQTTLVRNYENHDANGLKQEKATHIERSHITSRIINGQSAPVGRYPYIVSLTLNNEHRCGGSLIAPDIVLSAAHCATEDIQVDGVMIGRYDFEDDTEIYEHFVIETIKNHPKFKSSGHSLDYDFMIIKMYGTSKYPVVKINGSPKIPANAGDSLNVMGWGVTNLETQETATALQEVEVKYMSNQDCNKVGGYYNDFPDKILLAGTISEVMLCAKDEDEDACQGDSGGPLIIRGKSQTGADDLLVGVVSWGIGCAHQHFPGVYARISSQIGWINRWVCEWSESPPFDLGKHCQNSTGTDPTKKYLPKQPLIIRIHLDRYPQETGWLIRSKSDKITTLIFTQIGAYSAAEYKNQIIEKEIYLDVDREYEFIMLDAFGDGLQYAGSEYYLYRIIDGVQSILVYGSGDDFTFSIKHTFRFPFKATKPPTPAPVLFSYPTVPPTSSPTMERAVIFVEFKFDKFPEEVGWEVVSAYNGMLVASKPVGSYTGQNHQLLSEKVWLFGPESGSHEFMLTVYDIGNNGLCCDHGPGYYKVYLDEVTDDALLFGGDLYLNKEQYNFQITWPDVAPAEVLIEMNPPTVVVTDYPTTFLQVVKKKSDLEELLKPFEDTKEALSDIRLTLDEDIVETPYISKGDESNVPERSLSLLLVCLQTIGFILYR